MSDMSIASDENQIGYFPETLPQETQRILVVDDDPAIVKLLEEFMGRIGHQHRSASNGLDAMSLLEKDLSTIVITDLLMPKMDGMELIRTIKKQWPEIDVIVVTGYSRNFNYTDVIKAGASDFIQKPFNLNELEAKLNRIIRERGLRALLKRLSVRDILTDLCNRRFFDERLKQEAERATRQSYPLFLVMIDLDNFKRLNDTLGHQAGDEVLKCLANILKNSTRHHVDTPFRYGGDEFAIIIPQADAEQAEQIAERIRRNYLKENREGTTLSLGLSRFKRTRMRLGDDLNVFIRTADDAMYSAKKAGGNKLVIHEGAKEER